MANEAVLINSNNCKIEGKVVGMVAINCTNKIFTVLDNSKFFFANSVIPVKTSVLVNAASGPPTLGWGMGTYFIDVSGGGMTIQMPDPALYVDCEIFFKRIDNSANTITFKDFGGELFEFAAMPIATYLTLQGQCICVTSNGVDWLLKTKM